MCFGIGGGGNTDLIEAIEKFRDKGRTRARQSKRIDQAKVMQVADEAVGGRGREGKGVAPEVPLERDDAEGAHASPYHAKSRLAPRQARVEEA